MRRDFGFSLPEESEAAHLSTTLIDSAEEQKALEGPGPPISCHSEVSLVNFARRVHPSARLCPSKGRSRTCPQILEWNACHLLNFRSHSTDSPLQTTRGETRSLLLKRFHPTTHEAST